MVIRNNFGVIQESSGGFEISGLLKEYVVATSNISAGDFVGYFEKYNRKLTSLTTSGEYYFNVFKISETQVVLLVASGANTFYWAKLFFEEDGKITTKEGNYVSSNIRYYPGYALKIEMISENQFLIIGAWMPSGSSSVGCEILTLDENAAGRFSAATNISGISNTGRGYASLKKINYNQFLYVFGNFASQLYAAIITVENSIVTVETPLLISTISNCNTYFLKVLDMGDKNFFILHGSTSSVYAFGIKVTEGSIVVGQNAQVGSGQSGIVKYCTDVIKVDAQRVFVVYNSGAGTTSSAKNMVVIANIVNDIDVSFNASVQLSDLEYSGYYSNGVTLINPGRVVVVFGYKSGVAGVIVDIDNYALAPGTTTLLSDDIVNIYYLSPVLLENDSVLVLHGSSDYAYRLILAIDSLNIYVVIREIFLKESQAGRYLGAQYLLIKNNEQLCAFIGSYKNYIRMTYLATHKWFSLQEVYVGSNTGTVLGVAKTGGVEDSQIQVYVPYE